MIISFLKFEIFWESLLNHRAKRGGSLSGRDDRRGAYRSHEFACFEVKKSLSFERNYMKFSGGGVLPNTQGPIALFLDFATRGQSCVARKAEKWAFWPILSDFKAVKSLNRWERTPRSM